MATNTADKSVNDQKLKGMPLASKLTESLPGRSRGSLLFKRSQSGAISAYFRYRLNAKDTMISLGQYRLSARAPGLTLSELRDKAAEMALIASEHGDVKVHLAARAAAEKTQRQAVVLAQQLATRQGSFEELLNAYVKDLTARGKVKAKEVERLFQTHVIQHHPDLMTRPAKSITGEDIHLVMSALLARKPKGRGIGNKAKTANTDMRSTAASVHRYLKAAFSYGSKAHLSLDRDVSDSKVFDIGVNPATKVPTLANTRGGQTESLNPEELGELLRYLDTLPVREMAICKGLIYLGGQRMEQLLRVTWEDTSDDLLHLTDGKGQKAQAWDHLLPLTDRVKEILKPLFESKIGPGPFCIGRRCIRPDTAGKRFSNAGKTLSGAGKTQYFSYANVRVSTETLMASLGITKEIRSWLLSHGRSDVQSVHYDRYSYLPEKKAALELWGRYLDCLYAEKKWDQSNIILLSRNRRQEHPDAKIP